MDKIYKVQGMGSERRCKQKGMRRNRELLVLPSYSMVKIANLILLASLGLSHITSVDGFTDRLAKTSAISKANDKQHAVG